MQAKTQHTKTNKLPNLATAEEVNLLFVQLKAEIERLQAEVEQLKQRPVQSNNYQMSPKQATRWNAIRVARDSLKSDASVNDTKALLSDNPDFQVLFEGADKDQALEGLLKIALIQVGKGS